MTDVNFNRLLEEIYANFGRTRPAYGSPMYNNLHRRLCQENVIPDMAAAEIAHAFEGYDSLPMNLGKAIMAEYANWRTKHPEKIARRSMCPYCDPKAGPGFVFLHDAQGKNYLWRCICNDDLTASNFPVASQENIAQAGLMRGVCIDPANPGGARPDSTGFLTPECRENIVSDLGLGQRHKVRPEHLQAREDAGAYGFFGEAM